MNPVLARRRQSGALLLAVSLLLAMMAALAFGVNRAAGMDVNAVKVDYEQRNAAYLAEAAVAAAKWTNQLNKCGKANVPAFAFGGGTTSAAVTDGGSKRINVVATATTAAGTGATLTRKAVDIVDLTKFETKDMGGAVDTTLTYGNLVPQNLSDTLSLVSGQSNIVMSWGGAEVPPDSEVISAMLTLTQNGSGASARAVSVHRVTTQWDMSATWLGPRLLVSWSGGDYSPPAVAAADVGATAVTTTWDVTGLVDGWASTRLAKYGLLLRLPNPGQSAAFYSMEASSSRRPLLRVTFSKPC